MYLSGGFICMKQVKGISSCTWNGEKLMSHQSGLLPPSSTIVFMKSLFNVKNLRCEENTEKEFEN